ncbi:MAG: alpha/beta hydrolase [Solirubrobacterales bacterium]|nr:alpha/beta hydrolase [Solirubrobacterales bacterium]
MSLTERAEAWQARGRLEEFRGHRIHTFHQPGEGIPLVLLHGFPTCSYDFRELIALLPDREILAFDFLGFGLSDKPRDHSYTLSWQADLVEHLVGRIGGTAFVCAHDLGSSVATELMAREMAGELEFELNGAFLFNGSILLERSHPTLGQRLLRGSLGPVASRLTNESFFRHQLSSLFPGDHPVSDEELEDQWSLICFNDGHRLGHKLISYMDERVIYADRWHGAIARWEGDLAVGWGLLDPVAVTDVLDGLIELRPGLPVTRFETAGHYPQLEVPEELARRLAEVMPGRSASL